MRNELQQSESTPAKAVRLGVCTSSYSVDFMMPRTRCRKPTVEPWHIYISPNRLFPAGTIRRSHQRIQRAADAGDDAMRDCNIGTAEVHRYAGRPARNR